MKKLLFILTIVTLNLAAYAQQTEDNIHTGKAITYGNYLGTPIDSPKPISNPDTKVKPTNGSSTLTGIVVKVGWCEDDCIIFWLKKDDGTTVAVGTKDSGFTVPKKIVGKRILIEGIDSARRMPEKTKMKTVYQKDIQFAASGIIVIN